MVFNATFNHSSVTSCWSVLLVEETEVLRENHRTVDVHDIFYFLYNHMAVLELLDMETEHREHRGVNRESV